jgi:hypothetical protein
LISFARLVPLLAFRRRSILALGMFDEPRIKVALRDLIGR